MRPPVSQIGRGPAAGRTGTTTRRSRTLAGWTGSRTTRCASPAGRDPPGGDRRARLAVGRSRRTAREHHRVARRGASFDVAGVGHAQRRAEAARRRAARARRARRRAGRAQPGAQSGARARAARRASRRRAARVERTRVATRPSPTSTERRLAAKRRRSDVKRGRGAPRRRPGMIPGCRPAPRSPLRTSCPACAAASRCRTSGRRPSRRRRTCSAARGSPRAPSPSPSTRRRAADATGGAGRTRPRGSRARLGAAAAPDRRAAAAALARRRARDGRGDRGGDRRSRPGSSGRTTSCSAAPRWPASCSRPTTTRSCAGSASTSPRPPRSCPAGTVLGATSLSLASGRPIDRATVLATLLDVLEQRYDSLAPRRDRRAAAVRSSGATCSAVVGRAPATSRAWWDGSPRTV